MSTGDQDDERFEEVLRAVARAPAAPVATRFTGTARYQPVRRLGAGGFGDVYEAIDGDSGATVAVKVLRRVTPEIERRFERELRSLAAVSHPNLVKLHGLDLHEGHWILAMELVRGVPFLEWTNASLDRLRDATRQLVGGLAALHDAGLVHRDVKPTNVLVEETGRVILLDFGLVRDFGLTATTQRVGTPHYMSPEQCAEQRITPATDWYAVGVVLYEALTGRYPFEGNAVRVVVDKQTKDPPPPRSLSPSVPADLDALTLRLLARDPAARPGANEILASLEQG